MYFCIRLCTCVIWDPVWFSGVLITVDEAEGKSALGELSNKSESA